MQENSGQWLAGGVRQTEETWLNAYGTSMRSEEEIIGKVGR